MTRLFAILPGTVAAALGIAFVFAASEPAWAQGNKTGHSTEETQGESGKPKNENANPDNNGTKTTSGPKGQIDKDNTDCNNCTSSGPGNK